MIQKYINLAIQAIGISLKDSQICRLVKQVKHKRLTYLDYQALFDIVETLQKSRNKVKGIYIEAGTARGGSAIIIASVKPPETDFYLFDTFSQIPSPTEQDGVDVHERYELIKSGKAQGLGSQLYYGYQHDLLTQVKKNFSELGIDVYENRIIFKQGLFQDTMLIKQPVAFAHIDCDWYESVKYCLHQIIPNLQIGGTTVIDDYFHWSGCKLAVDEFVSTFDKINKYRILYKSRMHIQRIA